MRKRRRERRKQPVAAPLPLAPGWYAQWAGRMDWQAMDEASAKLLQLIISAAGDRIIHVEATAAPPVTRSEG